MRSPPLIEYSAIDVARAFMTAAHAGVGQKRKYSGDDYSVHPEETLQILLTYLDPTLAAVGELLGQDKVEMYKEQFKARMEGVDEEMSNHD